MTQTMEMLESEKMRPLWLFADFAPFYVELRFGSSSEFPTTGEESDSFLPSQFPISNSFITKRQNFILLLQKLLCWYIASKQVLSSCQKPQWGVYLSQKHVFCPTSPASKIRKKGLFDFWNFDVKTRWNRVTFIHVITQHSSCQI